jgi:hypothetical protein
MTKFRIGFFMQVVDMNVIFLMKLFFIILDYELKFRDGSNYMYLIGQILYASTLCGLDM